ECSLKGYDMTIRIIIATFLIASTAFGQEAGSPPATQPAGMPSLIQHLPDYSGDLAHRKYLTGDWGGARTQLAEKGVLFELDVTQILQGNAHGGKDTNNAFRYSGSADYYIKLDTARMGLWPGGLFAFHGETKIGDNVNPKVGSLMAPNFQGLLPVPGEPGTTTLSEFYFAQALSEQFVLIMGKLDGTSLADANAFTGNQRTQFMNVAFKANPVLFYGTPYTTMVAGAVWRPTKWLDVITAVTDNDQDGAATMTGFNTAFHGRDWYTATQEYDFTWKPFGKTGHQRLGWFWTSRDFAELSGDGRIQFPRGLSLADIETSPDTWGIYYNFDQYLFTEADDPEQGIGVFGRFGYGGEPNIFEQFYSFGVSGKGSIPARDRDTWGIGYYHANISDKIDPAFGLSSEQGVEAYYNIEITPWCHISPDLQVIVDPGGSSRNDVAMVYGLRMQMTF
ncbi:MAG: carbohydrate porin, partial [Phycisphaerae bacterium]|nr:carbohydrate porin [Phycisphaerae bacterium]